MINDLNTQWVYDIGLYFGVLRCAHMSSYNHTNSWSYTWSNLRLLMLTFLQDSVHPFPSFNLKNISSRPSRDFFSDCLRQRKRRDEVAILQPPALKPELSRSSASRTTWDAPFSLVRRTNCSVSCFFWCAGLQERLALACGLLVSWCFRLFAQNISEGNFAKVNCTKKISSINTNRPQKICDTRLAMEQHCWLQDATCTITIYGTALSHSPCVQRSRNFYLESGSCDCRRRPGLNGRNINSI